MQRIYLILFFLLSFELPRKEEVVLETQLQGTHSAALITLFCRTFCKLTDFLQPKDCQKYFLCLVGTFLTPILVVVVGRKQNAINHFADALKFAYSVLILGHKKSGY